jgi:membrane protease YdiL (CAAX protease family)
MQRTLRQPGFWLAVALTGIAMACQLFLTVPLGVIDAVLEHSGHAPLRLPQDPLVMGLVNLLSFGVAIAVGLVINRLSPRGAFPLGRIEPLAWVAMPLLILGAAILLSEADNVFRWLVPMPHFVAQLLAELFFPSGRLVSQFILLCMVAPLTEELLFRGIILRGLLGRFRPWQAVVLTAMLFAGMHLNPWQLVSAFVLGVLFGWFYLRTGSLWPCLVGHACYNSIVVILGAAPFGLWEPPTAADLTTVEFQPLWLDAVGALLVGVGLWLFGRMSPKRPLLSPELDSRLAVGTDVPPVLPVQ